MKLCVAYRISAKCLECVILIIHVKIEKYMFLMWHSLNIFVSLVLEWLTVAKEKNIENMNEDIGYLPEMRVKATRDSQPMYSRGRHIRLSCHWIKFQSNKSFVCVQQYIPLQNKYF